MPWDRIAKPKHDCLLPEHWTDYPEGSIWRCPECGVRRRVIQSGPGGGVMQVWPPWWQRLLEAFK